MSKPLHEDVVISGFPGSYSAELQTITVRYCDEEVGMTWAGNHNEAPNRGVMPITIETEWEMTAYELGTRIMNHIRKQGAKK